MIFTIQGIIINLAKENGAVRLITDTNDNVVLQNQTMSFVKTIVKKNFQVVKSHYQTKSNNSIDDGELNHISLKIILHYLYMYNMWRGVYEKERNRDLMFAVNDFEHPATYDIIIRYFKKKYPTKYSAKCELLIGMSADEFKKYEAGRERIKNR